MPLFTSGGLVLGLVILVLVLRILSCLHHWLVDAGLHHVKPTGGNAGLRSDRLEFDDGRRNRTISGGLAVQKVNRNRAQLVEFKDWLKLGIKSASSGKAIVKCVRNIRLHNAYNVNQTAVKGIVSGPSFFNPASSVALFYYLNCNSLQCLSISSADTNECAI